MRYFPLMVRQITTAIAVILFSQISLAQQPQGRVFGDGTPFGLNELPQGRARDKLESLPHEAQLHALAWLNRFSFHESDLEFLDFDNDGGVLYADTLLPENTAEAGDEAGNTVSTPLLETAANVFALHSKPGSSNVLFVDFDGHTISGTAWNSGGEAVYSAAPFDTEAGDGTLTDAERAQIQEIWHRIAEDFAPFDIDVTTEQPATFTKTTGHVLITRKTDTTGKAMPYGNGGGVAYVGVWGSSSFAYYSPALVYYDNLASHAPYISEAASHEAGHNLNLSHDGTVSSSYYSGHGSGYVSWAPIMGVGYYNNVTEWSKGEYDGATQTQDDISIIKGYLGQRSDDHGSSVAAATELAISGGTIVTVTNPETDPDNLYSQNKGIIETRADVDTFTFVSGGGTIDISATPAWDAYYRSVRRGANLDIELTLLDDTGVVATSDPLDDTYAQIVVDAPPGRYYLEVNGVGNSSSPYSDYGSLGQYFVAGSIPPAAGGDTTAPNPDPMTWSVAPQAINRGTIQMTATTATDDSGVVEYQFVCIVGGPGCTVSGWQSSPAYTAGGLNANTSYSFQVVARDLYNNVTTASPTAIATTPANAAPIAGNDAVSTNEDNPVTVNVLANDSDGDGDTLTVFAIGSATNGSTTTDGTTITYTPFANFSGNDSFSYSVNDGFGGTASAQVTITINPVNDAPTAVNDSASLGTNETVVINALANDSDLDGNPLTLVSVSSGTKGSAVITGSSISYTAGSKRGSDTLSYVVSDGKTTATASISISIGRSTSDGGGGSGDGKCHPVKGC